MKKNKLGRHPLTHIPGYLASLTLVLLAQFTGIALANPTQLTFYGHAAFRIITPKGTVLVIDPWLSNPLNPASLGSSETERSETATRSVGRTDYLLVTHGHFDHLADAVGLAKKTQAHLVANFELGENMVRLLGYPKELVGFDTIGNVGGNVVLKGGEVTVHFVPALHSSGIDTGKDREPIAYGGSALGFVVTIENGPTIYHSGDTAYFSDMKLIGENFHPDVALVNIGGHFGMNAQEAAQAAHAVQAQLAIPHHFKTFPVLAQEAQSFFKALDIQKIPHQEMQPGQTIEFEGRKLKK